MIRSHLCYRTIGPRIVGESKKEKAIKPKSQIRILARDETMRGHVRQVFAWDIDLDFLQRSCIGGGWLEGLNAPCYRVCYG